MSTRIADAAIDEIRNRRLGARRGRPRARRDVCRWHRIIATLPSLLCRHNLQQPRSGPAARRGAAATGVHAGITGGKAALGTLAAEAHVAAQAAAAAPAAAHAPAAVVAASSPRVSPRAPPPHSSRLPTCPSAEASGCAHAAGRLTATCGNQIYGTGLSPGLWQRTLMTQGVVVL